MDKIYRDVKEILADPEIAKNMREQGIEPVGSTPEGVRARRSAAKWEQWGKLLTEFNVKAN